MGQLLEGSLVTFLFGFLHLTVVDAFLALQQLKTHIGCAKIARDADEVGILRPMTIDDVFLLRLTDAGDGDGQTGIAGGRVAANDVDTPFVTGQTP